MDKDLFTAAEELKAVYEILAEFLDGPCNWNANDEYMLDYGGDWCEENCGKVPDSVCWKKFVELKMKERQVE